METREKASSGKILTEQEKNILKQVEQAVSNIQKRPSGLRGPFTIREAVIQSKIKR